MIIMNLEIDNFLAFNHFKMNFSYPKKIINSYIENEFLENRPNFRYKKVNIIMGSNATGKTSLGKMIMSIFNLMAYRNLGTVVPWISDSSKEASFSMDFVVEEKNTYNLYRIHALFLANKNKDYTSENSIISVHSTEIKSRDNYEICSKRLDLLSKNKIEGNYISELEKVTGLSWLFIFPEDALKTKYNIEDNETFLKVLTHTLKVLDPAITSVHKIEDIEDTYVIKMKDKNIIIKEGKIVEDNILSSGTKSGIQIAEILASIKLGYHDFYYCDEKFSYINSDIEKAILSIMINSLKKNAQLFFTTHNTDILDLPLPKHSFTFLKKEVYEDEQIITSINAGDYMKKATDSLRNAFDNDLFSTSPNLSDLYEIADL